MYSYLYARSVSSYAVVLLVRVVGNEQGGIGTGADNAAGHVLAQGGLTVGLRMKRERDIIGDET